MSDASPPLNMTAAFGAGMKDTYGKNSANGKYDGTAGNIIPLSKIREIMKERGAELREFFREKSVTIIVTQPSFDSTRHLTRDQNIHLFRQYQAALVSSRQKYYTLNAIGVNVKVIHLPLETTRSDFATTLMHVIEAKDTLGIIVQRPIPSAFVPELVRIPTPLDLDPLQRTIHFRGPVTAEAITRLVVSFASPADTISVVGGSGFIGSGVVKQLQEDKFQVRIFDKGDDLTQIKNTNVVIACTGVPDLLDERHISPDHKLVVSASFVPQDGAHPKTDVESRAQAIPQAITPVPGGIGPLEMATLVERVAYAAGTVVKKWDYRRDLGSPPLEPVAD